MERVGGMAGYELKKLDRDHIGKGPFMQRCLEYFFYALASQEKNYKQEESN